MGVWPAGDDSGESLVSIHESSEQGAESNTLEVFIILLGDLGIRSHVAF